MRTAPAQSRHLLPETIDNKKVGTASPQLRIPPDKIIHQLSYSHPELIVDLDDHLKRTFYEADYLRYFNEERPHQGLDNRTPGDVFCKRKPLPIAA